MVKKPFSNQCTFRYTKEGKWSGIGNDECSDPKILLESLVIKPEDLISMFKFGYFNEDVKFHTLNLTNLNWWSIIDTDKYGRCFTFKPTLDMITNGIQSIKMRFKVKARVYIHHPELFRVRAFRVPTIPVEQNHHVWVEVENEEFDMLDYGGETCNNEENYSTLQCILDTFDQEAIEKFGCTTPFGLNKDEICQNTENRTEVWNFFKKSKGDKFGCLAPCSFTNAKVITTREYDEKHNTEINIHFGELTKVTVAFNAYTFLNMIAEIGGHVGLFLGVSINQITLLVDFSLRWMSK